MEILNSGSFVAIDNREKIDQLIYTAREIASEVGRTEGFQNSGQTNHQLGLEMWKGAEYVCRAHEEANIRNLFLSKFLERLREIEKERTFQTRPALTAPVSPESVRQPASSVPDTAAQPIESPVRSTVPEEPSRIVAEEEDEYLGVVPADDDIENDGPSYADECVPAYDADMEALVDRLDNEGHDTEDITSHEPIGNESQESDVITSAPDSDDATTQMAKTVELGATNVVPSEENELEIKEPVEPKSIGPIVLAEKEPYNFDGCTVTAVVQLLPEAEGTRKCVVSVRTHDFTPRVAIVDVSAVESLLQISTALGRAFEQYRNELPAIAADKMKKEKPAAKKQSKTTAKSAKPPADGAKAVASGETTAASPVPNAETVQGQGGLF